MNQSEREQILAKLQSTVGQPGGKQVLRYALAILGSVPLAGGAIAGAGALWAEIEQNKVNQGFLEWANLTDSQITELHEMLEKLLDHPSPASLAILLGQIFGDDIASQLLSEATRPIPVVLNPNTLSELEPYAEKGWVKLQSTGSVCSMGAGNRVGNHVEERKRPYGMGSGFVLTVIPPIKGS